MHRFTLAAILLAIGSIVVSQIPVTSQSPLLPADTSGSRGESPSRLVILWDGFPLVWFFQLGLIIIWIEYRKLIDIEKENLECLSEK